VIETRPGDDDPGAIALMHKLAVKSRKRWPEWAAPEPTPPQAPAPPGPPPGRRVLRGDRFAYQVVDIRTGISSARVAARTRRRAWAR
jgi:hypothetical protein